MFAFIPLGLEGHEVRFPFVGLAILTACVGLFALTWLAEPNPMGVDEASTLAALHYFEEHPDLDLGPDFERRLLGPEGVAEVGRLRAAGGSLEPTLASTRALEQQHLDALVAEALGAARNTLFRRLALSTERGLWQPGWVTHLFLHAGWLHLLGNLLFLAAVALLLEDAWGRWRFLAFYLAGGVVSGAAQYALDRDTGVLLVGASGAVSACIGAAMVRFATRRMRVGYWLLFRVGTFAVPMWLWGLFKVVSDGVDLATGATPGVAVLAHLAGLGFGAAVALGMKAGGLDRTLRGTDEADGPLRLATSREVVDDAQAALAAGDPAEARRRFELARSADPDDADALWGLFTLDRDEQRLPQALAHLERLLGALLRHGQAARAHDVVLAALPALQPRDARPALALTIARQVGAELSRPLARRWWARAAEGTGATAAMAAVQAATLALDAGDLDEAARLLGRLAPGDVPEQLTGAVAAARARLEAGPPVALDVPPPVAPPPRPILATRRQLLPATVLAARADGLTVQLADGPARNVPLGEVKAVAAGYLPTPALTRQAVVLVVLDWGAPGRPAVVLQVDQTTGGVERLRPGSEAARAYFQFALWLAEKAGAPALPSPERLARGEGPFCTDAPSLVDATFGRPRPPPLMKSKD